MISWKDVNALQKQRLDLQLKLSDLLDSNAVSKDGINELRAEIKYLDKEINKILGSNEAKRIEEIKGKKSNDINVKKFFDLKDKYKKIKKISLATKKMLLVLEEYYSKNSIEQFKKVK